MHIASLEVHMVNTILANEIETIGIIGSGTSGSSRSSLSLGRGAEDAQSLVAIESVGYATHLRTNGSTIDFVVNELLTIRQFGDLVLVVTSAGTNLPLPVLQVEHLSREAHVEALVLQFTTIRPVLLQTTEVAQLLECEQVVGLRTEVVEAQAQAVIEEATLQTQVQATGGLPLNLRVTDTLESDTRDGVEELRSTEITACSVVVDIIITTDIIAGRELQVVDTLHISHPRLVGNHPSGLEAGEHAPSSLEEAEVATLLTEARRTVDGQVGLCIVASLVVVLSLCIPRERVPVLTDTHYILVLQRTAQERRLVTTSVVTHLRSRSEALPVDAGTTEEVQEVSVETLLPVDTGVTHH